MEVFKRFLEWIILKQKLHFSDHKPPLFSEGEIWWCSIGENVGTESNGKGILFSRPVVIFKKLSKENFLGLPATTKIKRGTWYVEVKHGNRVICITLSQARVFDVKRLSTRIGMIDEMDVLKIKRAFQKLFLP